MSLEENLEPIEYNISDVFIPLKHLRHFPKIYNLEDKVLFYLEIGLSSVLTFSQGVLYSSLYYMIS